MLPLKVVGSVIDAKSLVAIHLVSDNVDTVEIVRSDVIVVCDRRGSGKTVPQVLLEELREFLHRRERY